MAALRVAVGEPLIGDPEFLGSGILFGLGWRSAETNFFLDIGLPF